VTALHTTSKHLNQYLLNFWAKHILLWNLTLTA